VKPLTVNSKPKVITIEPSTTAKAYHIEAKQNTHCFVLTNQTKESFDHVARKYHIFLIGGEAKKVFEYELCVDTETFETHLFNMLNKRSDKFCFDTICKHGYGKVSESALSLGYLLRIHELGNIFPVVDNLLNISATEDLEQLNLCVIPRIYNWLVEVNDEAYQKRRRALLDYPILLVPIVTPLMVETIPTFDIKTIDVQEEQSESSVITKMIDDDLPIEAVLAETFGASELLIATIKGKRFWEITESTHPFSYETFRESIESYSILSQFLK